VDVTTQQDDEYIRTTSDQFMEDWNEPDFEQIPNQKPLLDQEIFIPTKHASNLLSIGIELVQLVYLKPVEPILLKHVYIFLETSTSYVQNESLK
jgi:hypothetical protein